MFRVQDMDHMCHVCNGGERVRAVWLSAPQIPVSPLPAPPRGTNGWRAVTAFPGFSKSLTGHSACSATRSLSSGDSLCVGIRGTVEPPRAQPTPPCGSPVPAR